MWKSVKSFLGILILMFSLVMFGLGIYTAINPDSTGMVSSLSFLNATNSNSKTTTESVNSKTDVNAMAVDDLPPNSTTNVSPVVNTEPNTTETKDFNSDINTELNTTEVADSPSERIIIPTLCFIAGIVPLGWSILLLRNNSDTINAPQINDRRFYVSSEKFDFEVEKKSEFPLNLIDFKEYNGFKYLAVLILLLAAFHLFQGIAPDINEIVHALFKKSVDTSLSWNPVDWAKGAWNLGAGLFARTFHSIDVLFRIIIFCCIWCITWLIFDPKNLIGYAIGIFDTILGIAYTISPVDAVPDIVPIAGTIDDVIFGIGLVIIGMSSIFKTNFVEKLNRDMFESIEGNNVEFALRQFFKENGYRVKKLAKSSEKNTTEQKV